MKAVSCQHHQGSYRPLAIEYGDLNEIVTVGNEANLAPKDSSLACMNLEERISLKRPYYRPYAALGQ